MKARLVLASLLICGFLGFSPAAHASYVDFGGPFTWTTGLELIGPSWSTTVDGVGITVTATDGLSLQGNSSDGIVSYGRGSAWHPGWTEQDTLGFDVRFSTPVQILSLTLVDFHRFQLNNCWTPPCAYGPENFGSYRVDEGQAHTIPVGDRPTHSGWNEWSQQSWTVGGTWYGRGMDNWDPQSFDVAVNHAASQIEFRAAPIVLPANTEAVSQVVAFSVFGISFSSLDSATTVPELHSSASATAVAMLLVLLTLLAEKRRRAS